MTKVSLYFYSEISKDWLLLCAYYIKENNVSIHIIKYYNYCLEIGLKAKLIIE